MSATSRVDAAARHVFGEEWAGALSRFTRINLRTCQRVKAAADQGQEHPSAAGVLAELEQGFQQAALMLQGGKSHILCDDEVNEASIRRGIRELVEAVAVVADDREGLHSFGPFLASGLSSLLTRAEEYECSLADAAMFLADAIEARPGEDNSTFLRILGRAIEPVGGIFGRRVDGTIDLLVPPAPLFSSEEWDYEVPVTAEWLLICLAGDREQSLSMLKTLRQDRAAPPTVSFEAYSDLVGACYVENPSGSHYIVAKTAALMKAEARRFLQSHGLQTNTRRAVPTVDD